MCLSNLFDEPRVIVSNAEGFRLHVPVGHSSNLAWVHDQRSGPNALLVFLPDHVPAIGLNGQSLTEQLLIARRVEVWRCMLHLPKRRTAVADDRSISAPGRRLKQDQEAWALTLQLLHRRRLELSFALHLQAAQFGPTAVDHRIGTFVG